MKVWQRNLGLIAMLLCLGQAEATTTAMPDPVLVPQKAIPAPVDKQLDTADSMAKPAPAPSIRNDSPEKSAAPNTVPDDESYPLVSKMEVITFGKERAGNPIEQRLTDLEKEVFHNTFADKSLFDRTEKLRLTILGAEPSQGDNLAPDSLPLLSSPSRQSPNAPIPEITYFELLAQSVENQSPVDSKELANYALQIINNARRQLNFAPLVADPVLNSVAQEHVQDLKQRRVVSHLNGRGENPDLRYTKSGGESAIVESVLALNSEQVKIGEYTRALVAHTFKLLMQRQDDRDALLSPEATGFGFALQLLPKERKAIACAEVGTKHAHIAAINLPLKVGDKVEVKGSLEPSYQFFRITIAWEGLSKEVPAGKDESDEALPYFPPLDYVGYGKKSEHDYSGAMTALKMGLLVGVVAGSVFMPPVALAAPLVVMGSNASEAKPVSDIPLHGGVKLDGNYFYGRIPLSNGGRPGIYYVTVWAVSPFSRKPFPISRRAFVLTEQSSEMLADKHSDKKIAKAKEKEDKRQRKQADKLDKHRNND